MEGRTIRGVGKPEEREVEEESMPGAVVAKATVGAAMLATVEATVEAAVEAKAVAVVEAMVGIPVEAVAGAMVGAQAAVMERPKVREMEAAAAGGVEAVTGGDLKMEAMEGMGALEVELMVAHMTRVVGAAARAGVAMRAGERPVGLVAMRAEVETAEAVVAAAGDGMVAATRARAVKVVVAMEVVARAEASAVECMATATMALAMEAITADGKAVALYMMQPSR